MFTTRRVVPFWNVMDGGCGLKRQGLEVVSVEWEIGADWATLTLYNATGDVRRG